MNSGVSKLTGEMSRYFSRKNDVIVYTLNWDNPRKYCEEVFGKVLVKKHPFYSIFSNFFYSHALLNSLKKDELDIIHSFHYGFYPAVAGLKVSLLKKIPHVFSPFFHPPLSSKFIVLPFYLYNLIYGINLFRKSSKVLVFSDYERKLIIKFGAKEKNLMRFPCPINTEFFKPSHKKDKNPKTVLFVHRLTEHKGADKFFNMARSILRKRNDVQFIVGGEGYLENLKHSLTESEKKRIKFIGKLNEEDLRDWYSRATVFVLPSRYESFSLSLAEAMSCRTLVVSTKVGAIPELVRSTKLGFLVDYGDWTKMEEYVIRIIDNEPLAKKMSKNCREYVKSNYDIEIVGKNLFKIYKSLINKIN